MYALKTLLKQRGRFFITSLGIALCIILMLFLLSIFKGVADGSMLYIYKSDADLWILQRHTSNIMRGTSLLMMTQGNIIKGIKGVKVVAPCIFYSSSIKTPDASGTVRLTGYDINIGKGGPPELFKGYELENDSQIILDRSFAAKYRIHLNEKIIINEDTLIVTGLSSGTNMGVYQYAFVTLKKAQSLIGFPGIVSCFQVKVEEGTDPLLIAEQIRSTLSNVVVLDRETFIKNNKREMESGFLPMLYVIAIIGAIVLTAILSLILSVYILELRKDYAIIKALGAPSGFISGIVLKMVFILSANGMAIAVVLFFPLLNAVEKLAPEVTTATSLKQILSVLLGLILISLISSFFPIIKLRRIYPLELFT